MQRLFVKDRHGVETIIETDRLGSVMEAIRGAGSGDLLALCGGSCSCATCNVYVDPSFGGSLPPMSDDENDLLESSSHRRPDSRLSCQLALSAPLDGLRVTIAPED